MRKWNMMLLALLIAVMPAAGMAQDLEQLFGEVYESIGEGLVQGVQAAGRAMESELTLSMEADGERLEEGKTLTLTITAGNPLEHETAVSFDLALPQHVTAGGETMWEAVLPAAQADAATGALVPSQTVITREITLEKGGESTQAQIQCEMAMGTRFYRALETLALCVPDVSVSMHADDTKEGRLNPGDAFSYRVEMINSGDAPKDMALELTLPETVMLASELPEGFMHEAGRISGTAHVPPAQGEEAGHAEIVVPAEIIRDALKDDQDAQRLIAPVLTMDGERIAAPRIQVCGPKVSARLMTGKESLKTGEETTLSVVVVNSGLAEADVQLSCVLPDGLTLTGDEEDEEKRVVPSAQGDDQLPGAGEAIPAEDIAEQPVMKQDNRTLVFDLHMDAARQTSQGVIAQTQVIEIPVRAEIAQEAMTQQMLGAALAWSVDDKPAQLGQAVAMSVRPQTVLGLTRADWNGVFWAGVLLLITLVCLYAAVKKDKREEDYCFE